MTAPQRLLKLYDLAPSPNNVKVRLALGYKNLPYEKIPVDPDDRAKVIEASGQPLAPVLVHGETVVFDSSAILRYLDANFRATPQLFSADRDTIKAIEEWELWVRTTLAPPVGMCFREFRKQGGPDADTLRKANTLLNEATRKIEETLGGRPFLLGSSVTAADVTAAPIVQFGMLPAEAAQHPFLRKFKEVLRLENAPRAGDWCRRLMAHDRVPA